MAGNAEGEARAAPRTLVVLPTYNERENLRPLAEQLLGLGEHIEVLVVDDNSPDLTGQVALALSHENPRVRILLRPGKMGLGTAYVAGFRYALKGTYERVVTMDADFSHDPWYVPQLIAGTESAEMCIGSRYVSGGGTRNWGVRRRVMSRLANWGARTVLGMSVRDCTSGFRCYRREGLERLPMEGMLEPGYGCLVEILYRLLRAGCTVGEAPIVFVDRRRGRSKVSVREVVGEARIVWRLRRAYGRLPARAD
jgi:dolichol-phosphate mannosyltransferase